MKKSLFLVLMLMAHYVIAVDNVTGRYYAELQAFKEASESKIIFDEDAHEELASIQRDMITYKNLTSFQRFVRSLFLFCDVVIVTSETMPLLYGYVDGVCKKAQIQTPTVFITRKDGFFHAFAQKLLMSSGSILIGQKLIKELSDEALEAVVAHELGHIRHNHINKLLLINRIGTVINIGLFIALAKHISLAIAMRQAVIGEDGQPVLQDVIVPNYIKISALAFLTTNLSSLVPAFIINKRFEKEADAFACDNGKAQGIIEFFELLLKKDQLREEEFATIREMLTKNKEQLDTGDYYSLLCRYYLAKAGHLFTEAYKTLYYETFWGAHPSPQARIKAAKQHLAQQKTA